jgi:rhodanese-related sulfurtransferase
MAKQHSPRFLKITSDAQSRVKHCSVEQVKQWLDQGRGPMIIDVREESEYAAGRIPTALPLSKWIIERDIEHRVPDPDSPLVLYCGGGFRSALAAENLERMGYTHVLSMDGGWTGWKEAGYPTEAPNC